ncbi:hypothetical protein AK830_g7533 [Neonectria ditissima]|uniref:Uncharacterized protein n=1 Tax=Neonectria ditissima TaxID=78410 RepID=A0A0P7AZF2_9HYPO|nr:hypothetical protein AK830_g7533 [Neonectria ditissima]
MPPYAHRRTRQVTQPTAAFMEDYLTKATALFPPREYLCLPNLSSTQRFVAYKGRIVSTRFDASDLTDVERKRLLKAFLRCELTCKISYAQDLEQLLWDEDALYRYRGRKFRPSEHEAIKCVYRYMESLYGAMFAHCSDSWLPDIPTDSLSSRNTGLLYPDTLYFNANIYASDMGWQDYVGSISEMLAYFGFGLITALLRSATAGKHGRDYLKRWFMDLHKTRTRGYLLSYPSSQNPDHSLEGTKEEHYRDGPGMYRMLYDRISKSFPLY